MPKRGAFPASAVRDCLTPMWRDQLSVLHGYQPWLKEQTKQFAAGCKKWVPRNLVACWQTEWTYPSLAAPEGLPHSWNGVKNKDWLAHGFPSLPTLVNSGLVCRLTSPSCPALPSNHIPCGFILRKLEKHWKQAMLQYLFVKVFPVKFPSQKQE